MSDSDLPIAEIDALLRFMTEYQRDEGMSDEAMAAKIGVPRPTWTAARNGRFRPALGFLRKVAAVPEFRQQARAILIPPVRVAR